MKKINVWKVERGQGLVEYAILVTSIIMVTLVGLTLSGDSAKESLLKVCAALGGDQCVAAQPNVDGGGVITPTPEFTFTPTLIPSATPTLSEPDPTRQPFFTPTPTPAIAAGLTVKVVDDVTSAPVAGVWTVIYNASGGYVKESTSGASGEMNFSLDNGKYQVRVYTGQWWQAADVDLIDSQEVTVRLKTLTVNVVDDATGAAVNGVWTVINNEGGGYVKEGTTGASGQLKFSLVNGKYKIRVYTGQWWQAAEVNMTSSQSVTVRLKTLTVNILDASGAPAKGVWTVIYNESGGYVKEGTTGSSGRLDFSLVDGKYKIRVYTGQWWQAAEVNMTSSQTVTIKLKEMRVKVVLNESGKEGDKGSTAGIWVVIYTAAGGYVTEGTTNSKGEATFSVANGDYIIATYYEQEWQRDGPFKVSNSREYVIHRKNKD
ncbi:MAG: hypothetical protein HY864_16245 [Chloroflexi bacterium]|nr:hypothetical protein [Chloroflexota bacterium]